MRLALHQPDQAGNVGTILRLAACLAVPVDIVEPRGFPFSDLAGGKWTQKTGPG